MIEDTATELNKLLLDQNRRFAEIVPMLRNQLSTEELKEYTNPIGHMMALSFDILEKLWQMYPDLKPDEFTTR